MVVLAGVDSSHITPGDKKADKTPKSGYIYSLFGTNDVVWPLCVDANTLDLFNVQSNELIQQLSLRLAAEFTHKKLPRPLGDLVKGDTTPVRYSVVSVDSLTSVYTQGRSQRG